MKRDMDLVRELLIKISDDNLSEIDTNDDATKYHLEILQQKNYIVGVSIQQQVGGGVYCSIESARLTWDGNEFLETIKSVKIWDKIKKTLNEKGVGLTIDAIKLAASVVIKSMIGPG